VKNIFEKLKKDKIVYIDIGARWGISEPWNKFYDIVNVIAFEPDPVECENLNAQAQSNDLPIKYFPTALSNKMEEVNLKLTSSRGCSSLLKPNKQILNEFPNAERFDIENTITLNADTLDSILERNNIANADFLKIDTQGTELNILQGSEKTLSKSVFGIQVEAEFTKLYEGQALFSDVDSFLRKKGFTLFDIKRYRWKRKNVPANMPCRGQVVFCDALYLKSIFGENAKRIGKSKGLKIIFISALLGYYDYGRYINELLLKHGIITKDEKHQIEHLLYIKPFYHIQRVKYILKKVFRYLLKPRGILFNWADSDEDEIEMYVKDLRRKIETH